jgi:DNA anti-recombination protein RmuC
MSDSSSSRDKEEWILLNGPKSVDNVYKVLQILVKNQQVLAVSIQQLLSNVSDKVAALSERMEEIEMDLGEMQENYETEKACINTISDDIKTLQESMQKVLDSIVEMDVREQNRRLRKKEAFSFQPTKNANF